MTKQQAIKVFEDKKVRTVWDADNEKWYFSIIDVIGILTDSADPKRYWSVLKTRLKKEGAEPTTICSTLKMPASDGKMRLTDVADQEQLFRLIQSIPSPKAEPFKMWMASVASERIDQMQDPEKSIDQAILDYKRLGYSDAWINNRLKSIEIRKELTDEWQRRGVENVQYATLTDIITKAWSGKTTREYKSFKGLRRGVESEHAGRGFYYRVVKTEKAQGHGAECGCCAGGRKCRARGEGAAGESARALCNIT